MGAYYFAETVFFSKCLYSATYGLQVELIVKSQLGRSRELMRLTVVIPVSLIPFPCPKYLGLKATRPLSQFSLGREAPPPGVDQQGPNLGRLTATWLQQLASE